MADDGVVIGRKTIHILNTTGQQRVIEYETKEWTSLEACIRDLGVRTILRAVNHVEGQRREAEAREKGARAIRELKL